MSWSTGVDQDRDGYWVVIESQGLFAERQGPFASQEEAKAQELRTRLEIRRKFGPSAFEG